MSNKILARYSDGNNVIFLHLFENWFHYWCITFSSTDLSYFLTPKDYIHDSDLIDGDLPAVCGILFLQLFAASAAVPAHLLGLAHTAHDL